MQNATQQLPRPDLVPGYVWLVVWLSLLLLLQPCAGQVTETQHYVQPLLWTGTLALAPSQYNDDLELLQNYLLAQPTDSGLIVLPASLVESPFVTEWITSKRHLEIISNAQLIEQLVAPENASRWSKHSFIWVETDKGLAEKFAGLDRDVWQRWLAICRHVLDSGGRVQVVGQCGWVGASLPGREALLSDAKVLDSDSSDLIDLMSVEVASGSICSWTRRQVTCDGDGQVRITMPATASYPVPVEHRITGGETLDWTQLRRSLLERRAAVFPSAMPFTHGLANGASVIGGGGGMPAEVWQRFVELAGGAHSHIVILPTAVEDPTDARGLEHRMLVAAGAGTVETLPQHTWEQVHHQDFLASIDRATGIWFGGGRQWRFVDTYWGTAAWDRIIDVQRRGGVIGGSSAGATIQGDLLVRGAPAGNHVMVADGYRRGLGLLPGVAIDQHFFQRNRFGDFEQALARFPTIYGIGVDEQTALVIQAPNQAEVLGAHSVWCYPSHATASRASSRIEHKSGAKFLIQSLP